MGVADRDGERVGGVGRCRSRSPDSRIRRTIICDLRLVGMAGADHRFLDQVGRIFGDRQPALGRRQQHDAAGDAELQGRGRVLVDKGLLDRGLVGAKALEHGADLAEQRDQPHRQRLIGGGMGDPVGDMGEAIAVDVDDPPAGVPQPGIEPENPHRLRPLSAQRGRGTGSRPGSIDHRQALSRAMTSSATSKLA